MDLTEVHGQLIRYDIENSRQKFGRSPLHQFVHEFWNVIEPGTTFLDNWHIGAMAAHLEAVYTNQIQNLVINVPPGSMKSIIANVMGPVYTWGFVDPGRKQFTGSHDLQIMRRDSQRSLELLQHPLFRATCPEFKLGGDKKAKQQFFNAHGGWRIASTPKGKGIGWHFHDISIDDPIKPSDIRAGVAEPLVLDAADSWISSTLAKRKANPDDFHLILIMQRLHMQDPAGRVLGRSGWEHLCVPMLHVPKCQWDLGSSLGGAAAFDPRTEEGELMWPERFTEKSLAADRANMTEADISAQEQQNPTPAGGNIVKEKYLVRRPGELNLTGMTLFQCWDFAFKGEESNSFTAGALFATDLEKLHLVQGVYGHYDFLGMVDLLASMQDYAPWSQSDEIYIEDKASGTAVQNTLAQRFSNLSLYDPGTPSKTERVFPHLGDLQKRRFTMPQPGLDWVDEAFKQITQFPRYGKDEFWDLMTMGFSIMKSDEMAGLADIKKMHHNLRMDVDRELGW